MAETNAWDLTDLTDDADTWLDDPHHRGLRHLLIVDVEHRRAYTWTHIGAGTPARVWHHVDRAFACPQTRADLLGAWLDKNVDLLDTLADEWQETQWDGRNHVGVWSREADDAADAIHFALVGAELPSRWLMSDYAATDPENVWARVVDLHGDDRSIAEQIAHESLDDGVHLDPEDVLDWIRSERAERAAEVS
jgi:hypothetical protein